MVPGLGQWLYPLPLSTFLAIALIASWLYFLWSKRRPAPGDARRLSQILEVLPREAISDVRGEDFAISWRASLTDPVTRYVRDQDEVEHHFSDERLEQRRKSLVRTGRDFIDEEATNAWDDEGRDGHRYAAFAQGKLKAIRTPTTCSSNADDRYTKQPTPSWLPMTP